MQFSHKKNISNLTHRPRYIRSQLFNKRSDHTHNQTHIIPQSPHFFSTTSSSASLAIVLLENAAFLPSTLTGLPFPLGLDNRLYPGLPGLPPIPGLGGDPTLLRFKLLIMLPTLPAPTLLPAGALGPLAILGPLTATPCPEDDLDTVVRGELGPWSSTPGEGLREFMLILVGDGLAEERESVLLRLMFLCGVGGMTVVAGGGGDETTGGGLGASGSSGEGSANFGIGGASSSSSAGGSLKVGRGGRSSSSGGGGLKEGRGGGACGCATGAGGGGGASTTAFCTMGGGGGGRGGDCWTKGGACFGRAGGGRIDSGG